MGKIFLSFMFLLFAVSTYSSDELPKSLKAVKTENPPKIDGVLDDPCWKDAPKATGFTDKLTGEPAPDETIAYILYDEENIYVGFYCYDSQPDKIVARETKRDGNFKNDDVVAFDIDPFHTHQYRSFFVVNAIGAQLSQIAGGRATKTEWKGDWKAAASRTKNGWSIEMAIPFAILDYPSKKEPITIGINFNRTQQRTNIWSYWSNIGEPERTEKDGHLVGIQFPEKLEGNRLSLMSYALTGVSPHPRPLSTSWRGENEREFTLRGGLDARYRISSSATAVLTLNPDFSNVEQEVESIDFSYQERWYSDSRPFFMEGGDYLGFPGFSFGRIRLVPFYSRRIPDIDFGSKFYGKFKDMTIGALNCFNFQSKRDDAVLAMKFRRGDYFDFQTQFIRNRMPELNNHVLSIASDLTHKILMGGVRMSGSFTRSKYEKEGTACIAYAHSLTRRFAPGFALFYLSKGYEALNGLAPLTDIKGYGFYFQSHIENKRFFKSIRSSLFGYKVFRLDNSFFSDRASFGTQLDFWKDYSGGLGGSIERYENYKDWTLSAGFVGNVSDQRRMYGVNLYLGTRAGKPYRFASPYIGLKLYEKLSLKLSSEHLWFGEEQNNQLVSTLNFDITPERGIAGRLVWRQGNYNFYLSYTTFSVSYVLQWFEILRFAQNDSKMSF
jgi:hypothetical protein